MYERLNQPQQKKSFTIPLENDFSRRLYQIYTALRGT